MIETRSRLSRFVIQVVVTVLTIPFVFPLVVMVQESLSGQGWGNYLTVLSIPQLPTFFRNSIAISALTIALVYAVTMLAAFAFAKLRVRGKQVYYWLLMAALTLPEVVLITPLFVTATTTNIFNTYWAVVLPLAALQIPFTILISRNHVESIPDQLLEAARIDGATTMQIFVRIILPLTRPIAAVIIVLTLIGAWNDYLLPLVFLQSPDLQVVTQVPSFFQGQFKADDTKVFASAVVIAIPEVLAYLLMQKWFERGISAGALK